MQIEEVIGETVHPENTNPCSHGLKSLRVSGNGRDGSLNGLNKFLAQSKTLLGVESSLPILK